MIRYYGWLGCPVYFQSYILVGEKLETVGLFGNIDVVLVSAFNCQAAALLSRLD